MSLGLATGQRLVQTASPRLQHAVRLLQMSSPEFAALVRDLACRNPFLELDDGDEGAISVAAAAPDADPENDRLLWRDDAVPGTNVRGATVSADDAFLESIADEPTLAAHLHEQINVMPLPPRDRVLAQAVIESLDDDGYLRVALGELTPLVALHPAPTADEWLIALKHVQALDPAGVAARDVGECLRLQSTAIRCAQTRVLAQRIIDAHLKLLASNDVQALARRLGVEPARVESACDRIRCLDPRPGWRFGPARTIHVVPDVIVARAHGGWSVQLNPAVIPKVRLNDVYAALFERHRGTRRGGELGAQLQEARWTLRNVEQRFVTILDVADAIVQRQRGFFELGAMAMKPLLLREIADAVGVHESTVSRVTSNKTMATPSGLIAFKRFFSRTLTSANGRACSGTAIREVVRELIEGENPLRPLSDVDVQRLLAEQGLPLARRTVTKYRQMLRIQPVERRRRHAA